MTDMDSAETPNVQPALPPSPPLLFASVGHGRWWFAPVRHDVNDVARDLGRAAENAAKSTVDITFINGSVTTITNPYDLRELVRPQDVASIRISFVYTDGSVISGCPIRRYLPGFFYSDFKPDVELLETEYQQPETKSRTKGYRLNEDWTARQAKASARISTILRWALVVIIVLTAFTILLSFIGIVLVQSEVAGYYFIGSLFIGLFLTLPVIAPFPTRSIVGTTLKESKLFRTESGSRNWLVTTWQDHLANFLSAVFGAVIAAILAGLFMAWYLKP